MYRVKVMLTMNKCAEAFWLGNLKNRDLKVSAISLCVRSSRISTSRSSSSSSDNDSIFNAFNIMIMTLTKKSKPKH